jgi:hypothetical protein
LLMNPSLNKRSKATSLLSSSTVFLPCNSNSNSSNEIGFCFLRSYHSQVILCTPS